MLQQKEDQSVQLKPSSPGKDNTHKLSSDVAQHKVARQLLNPDILSAFLTSRGFYSLFQAPMDTMKALTAVVQGDVGTLLTLVKKDPGVLFHIGNIKAPRGQIYYNVSPYMLMKFLSDADMLARVTPYITEEYNRVRQAQNAELGRGGADIVKLDFNPEALPRDEFDRICHFKTNFDVWGTTTDVTFSLLENPDGLLYWKDVHGNVNFYYAHRDTQTIIPITPVLTTPEEQQALDVFKTSFDTMENNSARRSTNKEHQLIAKLMQHALHRQGIHYSAKGEEYRDSHTPFHLINRYRICIRLYQEAEHNDEWDRAYQYWREGVGRAQGEEMWLLQRLCEKNRPFYPVPQHFSEFKRGFEFYNYETSAYETAFSSGRLAEGLGEIFGLYKGARGRLGFALMNGAAGGGDVLGGALVADLIADLRLIEDSKTKIIGLGYESDHVAQPQL